MADNRWKVCTCTKCGSRHECTPYSDFYIVPGDPNALLCEACFAQHIGRPITVRVVGKIK